MVLFMMTVLIGFVSGLRTMTAPAAISIAAYLGWLKLADSWAAFLGHWLAVVIFVVLALVEFVTDQLPGTPSRTVPQQFGARILSGAFCGAVIGTIGGSLVLGLIAGVMGSVLGTLGGYEGRKRLVAAIGGKDLPIAILEDAIAVLLALWVVTSFS